MQDNTYKLFFSQFYSTQKVKYHALIEKFVLYLFFNFDKIILFFSQKKIIQQIDKFKHWGGAKWKNSTGNWMPKQVQTLD